MYRSGRASSPMEQTVDHYARSTTTARTSGMISEIENPAKSEEHLVGARAQSLVQELVSCVRPGLSCKSKFPIESSTAELSELDSPTRVGKHKNTAKAAASTLSEMKHLWAEIQADPNGAGRVTKQILFCNALMQFDGLSVLQECSLSKDATGLLEAVVPLIWSS
eukprot:g16339.t1